MAVFFAPPQSESRSGIDIVDGLASFGEAVACVHRGQSYSYQRLDAMAGEVARRLAGPRRLALVRAANTPAALAGYLGALRAGHPVVLSANDEPAARLSDVYSPDLVVGDDCGETRIDELRAVSAHRLHPDLALLLSTSGTTGSPKLVRLSRTNLDANCRSIADYLSLSSLDTAATTLPMHYCYGLSVIHSHLLVGASLLLTDLSVVDECFWRDFTTHRATSFAGVPHTFELLERSNFAARELPDLRYVTQAGGRLDPARVKRFAELGCRRGWELFVMYGQTEATARMAYLPPSLAAARPAAIGVAIPGGEFAIEVPRAEKSLAADGSGELVFRGPNVMLGYAERPADLARGRTVDELRTGDLARRADDGLIEITGRLNRFVKIFGLRVDLQRAEDLLAGQGVSSCCLGSDDELVVAFEGDRETGEVRHLAAAALGLAPGAVRAVALEALPRLASGKLDSNAVAAAVAAATDAAATQEASCSVDRRSETASAQRSDDLTGLFAEVLDLDPSLITSGSTFVGLGGDSLSYVEMSVALESALGELPAGWHLKTIAELAATASPARARRGRFVEMSVLLRAAGIVLIVGSHAGLFTILGAAHALIAVAGFNFARFMLGREDQRERVFGILRGATRIVVPSVIWIAFAFTFLTDDYRATDVLMLDAILGPSHWTPQWHFWFIEVLVYLLVMAAALFAIPAAHRAELRHRFAFPLALVAWGLILRYGVVALDVTVTKPVLWLFALGWAAARANTAWRKALVSLIAILAVPTYFGDLQREAVITGGILAMTWFAGMRVPAAAAHVFVVLASASLYIYVTHWQVFRHMLDRPLLGALASLAVGVGYWRLTSHANGTMKVLRSKVSAAGFEPAASRV